MRYIIDSTKTSAVIRKFANNADVANMFRANIENCEAPKYEKIIDGYFEFLFVDKNGNPLVVKDIVSKVKYCSQLQTAISERLKKYDLSSDNQAEFEKIDYWLKNEYKL